MENFDYLIIGGGIIGLSVAHVLRERFLQKSICIIEKEVEVAMHASGRNSGVLHAGFYYSSDSLKAKLTVSGNRIMKEFCAKNDIKMNNCGKVVVAKNEKELPSIYELIERGKRNGVELKLIDKKELFEIDPNIETCEKAIFSPTTTSINPADYCMKLKKTLLDKEVIFKHQTTFQGAKDNVAITSKGSFKYGYLVNCAGLYADVVAKKFGVGKNFTILPFRGSYFKYSGDHNDLKLSVYPVPDLRNPFLGVHFTKTVDEQIKIGPSAMPALWREQYGLFENFKLSEMVTIAIQNLKMLYLNPDGYRMMAWNEIRKLKKSTMIDEAMLMVKKLGREFHVMRPGIRAQLLDMEKHKLVMDFEIQHGENSIHVLNAVSPAFTCSFTIAAHIVNEMAKNS